jgi:hypothetical protein
MVSCTVLAAGTVISVSHAWIRLLPGNLTLAGYFDLHNTGDQLSLVGAESADFGRIKLHRSMEMQGMEHMLPVERVTIPVGARVVFAPGGYHMMLFDPHHPLKVGEHVIIVLRFADGHSRPVSFVVKSAIGQ